MTKNVLIFWFKLFKSWKFNIFKTMSVTISSNINFWVSIKWSQLNPRSTRSSSKEHQCSIKHSLRDVLHFIFFIRRFRESRETLERFRSGSGVGIPERDRDSRTLVPTTTINYLLSSNFNYGFCWLIQE